VTQCSSSLSLGATKRRLPSCTGATAAVSSALRYGWSVRPLAEEVVQDIFTRLWRDPDRFDPARGSLRSFLLGQ
jgi:hypothetical protein